MVYLAAIWTALVGVAAPRPLLLRRRRQRRHRLDPALMAGVAGDAGAGLSDSGDVVGVCQACHLEHETGHCLLPLGIGDEIDLPVYPRPRRRGDPQVAVVTGRNAERGGPGAHRDDEVVV